MSRRLRVRENPVSSFVGGIVGLIFTVIGLTVVIPQAGAFGFLWTGIALVGAIMSFYNAFSDRGIAKEIIDVSEDDGGAPAPRESAASRLTQLKELKDAGLITSAEYEQRRAVIVREL
ncbi:MAG TPA: SHOCT domain-containing protein [Chthoniobacteraceae bacterium]|jgi:hypothetical protein|nr:SHOCT domain-containing protein [Chthoniobacteraceae bacterium]